MIRIEFVCSPEPRRVVRFALELPEGATLSHALRAAAAHPQAGFLQQQDFDAGLWGRRQPLSTPLTDGDRVEAYRALRCDPKEARRLRYRQSPAPVRRPQRTGQG
jgi:putative ubiquitin-RnfH superfamily antitoxin RatB of RatAB toxin-antitoxin module